MKDLNQGSTDEKAIEVTTTPWLLIEVEGEIYKAYLFLL